MADADLIGALARLASDVGVILQPPGHADLLDSITKTARRIADAAACSIATLDHEEMELEFVAASGAGSDQIVGTKMPAGTGIAGWVVAAGQSLSVSEAQRDPRFAQEIALASGYVPRSIHAIPLLTDEDEAVGVLEILDGEADADPQLAQLVGILAEQASVALQSAAVFADVGAVVLQVAAKATEDADLVDALEQVGAKARGRRRQVAELASLLHEAGEIGDQTRTAATRILAEFLSYALAERPLP